MDAFLYLISGFFLFFVQKAVVFPAVLFGYIWLDRKYLYQLICLLLVNVFFNNALKSTFQVPLYPHLGEGFAFPSGHMQSAIVLYGALFVATNNCFYRLLLLSLLYGVGNSLVYRGYHDYNDVYAAVFFGVLEICLHSYLLHKKEDFIRCSLIITAGVLMIYAGFVYRISDFCWQAYYSLCGLIIGHKLISGHHIPNTFTNKTIATALSIFGFVAIIILFETQVIARLPVSLCKVNWALIGFMVAYSPIMAAKIQRHKFTRISHK